MTCTCRTCTCPPEAEMYRNVETNDDVGIQPPKVPDHYDVRIDADDMTHYDAPNGEIPDIDELCRQLGYLQRKGDSNMANVNGVLQAANKYGCHHVVVWLTSGRDVKHRTYPLFLTEGPKHYITGEAMDGLATLEIDLGRWESHTGEDPDPTLDRLVIRG